MGRTLGFWSSLTENPALPHIFFGTQPHHQICTYTMWLKEGIRAVTEVASEVCAGKGDGKQPGYFQRSCWSRESADDPGGASNTQNYSKRMDHRGLLEGSKSEGLRGGTRTQVLVFSGVGWQHTSYLSHFLHNHNLSPENFTLESA